MAEGGSGLEHPCSVCLQVLPCGHTYCTRCVEELVDRNGPSTKLRCPTCHEEVHFLESGGDMEESGSNLANSCSVCLEVFKTPKVLSCGHSFCLRCVEKLVDRNGLNPTLRCPTCRKEVCFPESGKTEDLTTNFQLMSIVDNKNERTNGNGASNNVQSMCDAHQMENELYCESCDQPICVKCTLVDHDVGEHLIVTKTTFLEEQKGIFDRLNRELANIGRIHDKLSQEVEVRTAMMEKEKEELGGRIQHTLERKRHRLMQTASELQQDLDYWGSTEKRADFRVRLSRQREQLDKLRGQTRNIAENLREVDGFRWDFAVITSNLMSLATSVAGVPYEMKTLYEEPEGWTLDMGQLRERGLVTVDKERFAKTWALIEDAREIHERLA